MVNANHLMELHAKKEKKEEKLFFVHNFKRCVSNQTSKYLPVKPIKLDQCQCRQVAVMSSSLHTMTNTRQKKMRPKYPYVYLLWIHMFCADYNVFVALEGKKTYFLTLKHINQMSDTSPSKINK